MSKDLSSLFNETVEGDEDIWHSFAGTQQNNSGPPATQQANFDWNSPPSAQQPVSVNQQNFDWNAQPQTPVEQSTETFDWSSPSQPVEPTRTSDWPAQKQPQFDWNQAQAPHTSSEPDLNWGRPQHASSEYDWGSSQRPTVESPTEVQVAPAAAPAMQPFQKGFSIDDDVVEEPKLIPPVVQPTNLIAARRLQQQQQAQDLFKPEQDVIYKQYNPNPTPVMPPPGGPPSSASPPPRIAAGPPQPVFARQPSPYVAPVTPVAPPMVFSPVLVQPAMYSAPAPQQPIEMEKKRTGGLQSFVSIGFGGRIVMAGGRLGSRVKLGCVGDILSESPRTKSWIHEIKNAPSALGSVSDFTTEMVQGFMRSAHIDRQDRFGISSMDDSSLLMAYLASLLDPKPTGFGAPSARTQFIAHLWDQAVVEYGIERSSVLFQYLDKVVRGDMRGSIEVAKLNPVLHPICMAISSIHSAEFFRESILSFSQSLGTSSGLGIEHPQILVELVKTTLAAFASTGTSSDITPSVLSVWKLHMCLASVLVKPGDAAGGGVNFLLRLGDALCHKRNVSGGHLCTLLSYKRTSLDSVDAHDSLICILGADHRDISHFYRLLDSGPLMLSEFFEYVVRVLSGPSGMNASFFMCLQPWKFAYASMLACDLGYFDISDRYIQVINAFVRAVPTSKYTVHFRNGLRDLEMRMHQTKDGSKFTNTDMSGASLVGISDVGQAALGAIWGSIKAVASTR